MQEFEPHPFTPFDDDRADYCQTCGMMSGASLANHTTVQCPQCYGDDPYCMFCEGEKTVTVSQASEWHTQNDEADGLEFEDALYLNKGRIGNA